MEGQKRPDQTTCLQFIRETNSNSSPLIMNNGYWKIRLGRRFREAKETRPDHLQAIHMGNTFESTPPNGKAKETRPGLG